jgi:hypothetical protein
MRLVPLALGLAALVLTMSVGLSSLSEPAQAAATVSPLSFSRTKTNDNRPIVPLGAFRYPVGEVWVTFEVSGLQPNDRLTRIVRFNGEDRAWTDFTCPARGRCAFRIAATPPDSLTEGGWQVVILVNSVQASIGGFGVTSGISEPKATPGSSS